MQHFDELNLPQQLRAALKTMNFTTPTPIQAQSIPPALEGRDILGSAATGTGKTGAFGIPLVNRLLSNPRGSALILCPTRELATQVLSQLKAMVGVGNGINTALLIGGESMPKQLQELRARPRIIVGTPGRINDHLERGSLNLDAVNTLVLDEADEMLRPAQAQRLTPAGLRELFARPPVWTPELHRERKFADRVKVIVDAMATTEITRAVGIRKRVVSYS